MPKNVRKLNIGDNQERVETGAVQFNDDWPGLFIRGDEAAYLARLIDQLFPEPTKSLAIIKLQNLSAMIKNDVVVSMSMKRRIDTMKESE